VTFAIRPPDDDVTCWITFAICPHDDDVTCREVLINHVLDNVKRVPCLPKINLLYFHRLFSLAE